MQNDRRDCTVSAKRFFRGRAVGNSLTHEEECWGESVCGEGLGEQLPRERRWAFLKLHLQQMMADLHQEAASERYRIAQEEDAPAPAEALSRTPPTPAEDESAYRPAKEFIIAGQCESFKQLHKILAANPSIRHRRPNSRATGRPITNRLEVHAGDWMKYLNASRLVRRDPGDWQTPHADYVKDVEARKAEELSRKMLGG